MERAGGGHEVDDGAEEKHEAERVER